MSLLLTSGSVLQAFREEVAPLRQDVRIVNELSAELTPLDIQLSSTASRQLDQLNMRWKLLQVLSSTVQMFHTHSLRWPPKFPTVRPLVTFSSRPAPGLRSHPTPSFFLSAQFLRLSTIFTSASLLSTVSPSGLRVQLTSSQTGGIISFL